MTIVFKPKDGTTPLKWSIPDQTLSSDTLRKWSEYVFKRKMIKYEPMDE